MTEPLLIARSNRSLYLLPQMANRHGLVAGATGTGKTVTLQVMAEAFSRIGVPVFAADIKGDLSGISQPGTENSKMRERLQKLKLDDFAFLGMSGYVLGCIWRARPSRPRHHIGDGAAVARTPTEFE